MRYEKSDIKRGMYLELDCPIRTRVLREPPAPVRYGEPSDDPPSTDFKSISAKLDQATQKLHDIIKAYKNPRR